MVFVNFQLPEDIERGVIGGPEFKTTVFPIESGLEQRNIDWIAPRGRWDAGFGLLRKFDDGTPGLETDIDLLVRIFYAMEGKGHSFMFKDFADFEIGYEQSVEIAIQTIALGDDTTTVFNLFKDYTITLIDASTRTYVRPLTKFIDDALFKIYLDGSELTEGVNYTVDYLRGILTMIVAPASTGGTGPSGEQVLGIRATFLNHVRFDNDKLDINMELFNAGRWPNFPLIELRENGLDLALP